MATTSWVLKAVTALRLRWRHCHRWKIGSASLQEGQAAAWWPRQSFLLSTSVLQFDVPTRSKTNTTKLELCIQYSYHRNPGYSTSTIIIIIIIIIIIMLFAHPATVSDTFGFCSCSTLQRFFLCQMTHMYNQLYTRSLVYCRFSCEWEPSRCFLMWWYVNMDDFIVFHLNNSQDAGIAPKKHDDIRWSFCHDLQNIPKYW